MVAPPRGLRIGGPAQSLDRFARHQHADRAKQDDVERADDDVDLADRAEETEQECAEPRADHATRHHHRAHAVIDPAAPAVREHAGHAGPGHLRRGRRRSDRGRNAVEDQQRRGEKAAAHAEQARKDARQPPERDNPQSIDGQVRDGEVDVHGPALSQGRFG